MQVPLIHVATSFVAASLLFAVQPWAARLMLPWFGGSASVWLTTLLFFQTSLLLGYLYAHLIARAPRWLHVVLLLGAAAAFPLDLRPAGLAAGEVVEVLATLAVSVGAVVILVAATTPLLHRWLAGDSTSREPYSLYAASNAGSLLGLLGYPLAVEPWLALDLQTTLWWGISGAIVLLVAASAAARHRLADAEEEPEGTPQPARWFINAFVPASLLYGFTAYVTRDIAAVPMLWVVPLSIYLVTFILAFARRGVRFGSWFAWAGAGLIYVVALVSVAWPGSLGTLIGHGIAFGAFAMYFHGELSRDPPPSSWATRYYLWIASGGVCAGVFHSVLAPLWFDAPLEYPLTYGLALVLLPANYGAKFSPTARKVLHATMMLVLAIAFTIAPGGLGPKLGAAALMALAFLGALSFPALSHVMLALFLGAVVTYPGDAEVVERHRSFYGTHTVERRNIDDTPLLALTDGLTQHGVEPLDDDLQPLGYYHRGGPCGEVFEHVANSHRTANVAIVGLGIGSMALFSRPGDTYRFFELDAGVVRLARTSFRTLAAAQGTVDISVVDGRLGLTTSPDRFDLIVVDAFSSDAIPIHLLTAEAFELYRSKLAPAGLLLLHTSNRYLDIDRVAIGALDAQGWEHRQRRHQPGADDPVGAWPSSWVVAAPTPGGLGELSARLDWQRLRSDIVWTDNYASLLAAFR